MVGGQGGLEKYRDARRQEIRCNEEFGGGDCFHDREKVLGVVERWHCQVLPGYKRVSDHVTDKIWDRLLIDMLEQKEGRPTAMKLGIKAKRLLKDIQNSLSSPRGGERSPSMTGFMGLSRHAGLQDAPQLPAELPPDSSDRLNQLNPPGPGFLNLITSNAYRGGGTDPGLQHSPEQIGELSQGEELPSQVTPLPSPQASFPEAVDARALGVSELGSPLQRDSLSSKFFDEPGSSSHSRLSLALGNRSRHSAGSFQHRRPLDVDNNSQRMGNMRVDDDHGKDRRERTGNVRGNTSQFEDPFTQYTCVAGPTSPPATPKKPKVPPPNMTMEDLTQWKAEWKSTPKKNRKKSAIENGDLLNQVNGRDLVSVR